jgi:3',5'-cyclic AMP phosphodiesterase CpdA
MLLPATDQQDSEEGSQYTGSHSSYSGQSEGPIDGEDWGTAVLASDADAAQEQQLEPADDLQDGVSLPHDSVDALGVVEPDAAAQGAPAAAAAAGGDVESEIAEALAAAAAAAGAAPAAAGGVPVLSALSLEEEIAQALAAAEAAGDAAVAAGSSAAAAASDS